VLRDARATSQLSLDRYDLMRATQIEAQPDPNAALRVNSAPVLPPQRAPEPASAPKPAVVPPTSGAEPALAR
jgi:general secretion pathway protein D